MTSISNLHTKLAKAKNIKNKYEIISQLGEQRNEKAVEDLIECLREEDEELKIFAANALIKIGGRKICNKLIKLLRNDSWITRMKATEILGELKCKNASWYLCRLLKNDPNSPVREWAAISLGKIGEKRNTRFLLTALLKDENWEVRMEAAYALGKIGFKKIKNTLLFAFQTEKEYRVRWAITITLSKIAHEESTNITKKSIDEVIHVLNTEKDQLLLGVAVRTLGEIGKEGDVQILYKTMKISKELVKLEINIALETMAKRFNYKDKDELIKNVIVRNKIY